MTFLPPSDQNGHDARPQQQSAPKPRLSPFVALAGCAAVAVFAFSAVAIRAQDDGRTIIVSAQAAEDAVASALARIEPAAAASTVPDSVPEQQQQPSEGTSPAIPELIIPAPQTEVQPKESPKNGAKNNEPAPDSTPESGAADANDADDDVSIISLQPHKALYEVRLTSLKTGAQISNLYGQMFFEWKQDCEAWISGHRSNLFYEYAEGGGVNLTTDFATYEGLEGRSVSFNTRREQGGKLFEEFRGYADLDDTGAGQARYTIPDGLTYALPEGTLFPMRHTIEILQKAKEGARLYNATIFDGSDDEGPHDVNTFISDKIGPEYDVDDNDEVDAKLLNGKAWLLRMAFFPLKNQEESADYEMTLVAHENGVVSYVSIEYDKFAIEQKLLALEALDRPDCSHPQ